MRRANADKVFGDITGHRSPSVGLHYQLSCYVTRASTRPSPFEGWATFAQIFRARPDDHRFAVAQRIVLSNAGEGIATRIVYDVEHTWLAWDFHHPHLAGGINAQDGLIHPPAPIWTGPSEDGLIMKAMALYDRLS
jgi:hypothetical protein